MNQAIGTPMETKAVPASHWWVRLIRAPVVLQAYIVFVLCAVSFSLTATFVPRLGSVVVQHTGWTGGVNYGFTLFFAVAAGLTQQRRIVYGVTSLLGLFASIGCLEMIRHMVWPWEHFQNPYLTYGDLRPAFDIVLPAFWIALLLSPGMRKWIRGRADGRQISLKDLLYLMLIVSVALGSSLALAGLVRTASESSAQAPAAVPATGNPGPPMP